MTRRTDNRYIEKRGEDVVGAISARRIPTEKLEWLSSESKRVGRTQRAVFEDVIESFLKHRKASADFQYTAVPKHTGRMFRAFIRTDLLYDALETMDADGVSNADFINAALAHEMEKGS